MLIDAAKNPVGYRASVTVSRYHLERQVLKHHVDAAATGAPDNDPRVARLWARFHKDFRRDWAENGGKADRVPLALALGFCVEAVRDAQHDPQVLPIAVSLLGMARRDGLGSLNAPVNLHRRGAVTRATARGQAEAETCGCASRPGRSSIS